MTAKFELCKRCYISPSYRNNESVTVISIMETDNSEGNRILAEIMVSIAAVKVNDAFTVLSDGNRYRITVLHRTKKHAWLLQQYLHYSDSRLWPVFKRFVKLVF